MTVLRTDRKHASNCMTEENGVEKVKKRKNFFRSLRFRILIILIILGIVPGVIVTYTMLHNYQNRAVAMLTETVSRLISSESSYRFPSICTRTYPLLFACSRSFA